MTKDPHKIVVGDSTYDCAAVDPVHMPTIERILSGTTSVDEEIDRLAIPVRPLWLAVTIHVIRWYRTAISPRLGSRCVFVPSCSHYAEQAFRNRGFLMGFVMTCKRLLRCRAGAGGNDFVKDKTGGEVWSTESNPSVRSSRRRRSLN